MILTEPVQPVISKRIPPNLSTWQTIELSYACAKYAVDNNIPGQFVECGVAAGNNLAAMCLAGRHGYGFDSFEGIPWAGRHDKEQPGIGKKDKKKYGLLETSGISSYSFDDVRSNFWRWGVSNYTLIPGWFQNTVKDWFKISTKSHTFDEIAVLRLDGDLYESTFECLALFSYLSKGGILIIDDWQLPGCQKAFADYFHSHPCPPEKIFDNGVTYWIKKQ